MVRAWVRHNIEEVGHLEQLLPGLPGARGLREPSGLRDTERLHHR